MLAGVSPCLVFCLIPADEASKNKEVSTSSCVPNKFLLTQLPLMPYNLQQLFSDDGTKLRLQGFHQLVHRFVNNLVRQCLALIL